MDLQNNFSESIIVYFYGDKVNLISVKFNFSRRVLILKIFHILHFRSAFCELRADSVESPVSFAAAVEGGSAAAKCSYKWRA